MACTHDFVELDAAIADGYCPLCMATELKSIKAELSKLRAALAITLPALLMAANRFDDLSKDVWEADCWDAHQKAAGLVVEQQPPPTTDQR